MGVAVDGGDDDRTRVLQRLEGGAEALCHETGPDFVAVGEALEVGSRAEEFLSLAG